MDSKYLTKKLKIKKWVKAEKIIKKEDVPDKPGIYFIKLIDMDRKLDTVSGEPTDIIYIGQAAGKKGLSGRIFKNYIKGQGINKNNDKKNGTGKRINRYLFGNDKKYSKLVEFGWKKVTKPKKKEKEYLKNFEKTQLKKFEEEHDQLPAWNRRG